MTTDDFIQLVELISYKPGFSFLATRGFGHIEIQIVMIANDAYNAKNTVQIYQLGWLSFDVLDTCTERDAINKVYELVINLEKHETQERFAASGSLIRTVPRWQ